MSKAPLDYQGDTQRDDARPGVRWQTVVSCTFLGMAALCGIAALVWPQPRHELAVAAISLAIAGAIIYFPFVRT